VSRKRIKKYFNFNLRKQLSDFISFWEKWSKQKTIYFSHHIRGFFIVVPCKSDEYRNAISFLSNKVLFSNIFPRELWNIFAYNVFVLWTTRPRFGTFLMVLDLVSNVRNSCGVNSRLFLKRHKTMFVVKLTNSSRCPTFKYYSRYSRCLLNLSSHTDAMSTEFCCCIDL